MSGQNTSSAVMQIPESFSPDIRVGDIFTRLAEIEDDSVDCVVTSPPYWGLRDYGVEGQLGLEPTLAEHIDTVVRYCRELKRVLKPTGTFWLNYGDCYATSPNGRSAAQTKALSNDDRTFRDKPFSTIQGTLKPKDLCMVPNRIAIALQDDGWFVRSEIIWAKPNPMPESIKDRPATSHEKIFLLTKAPRYFYDADSVRQGVSSNTNARTSKKLAAEEANHRANGGSKTKGPMRAVVEKSSRKLVGEDNPFVGQKASREAALSLKVDKRNLRNYEPAPKVRGLDPRHQKTNSAHTGIDNVERGSRNLRNWESEPAVDQPEVWKIATRPFSKAHFATFPPALAERCIQAGCPEGGLVLDCFGGAGTTGLVARRLQRRSILIELNPDYADIARERIFEDAPLFDGAGL